MDSFESPWLETRWRSLFNAPLPQDIIVDILSLLPVKSLLRFEGVSKPFSSLIRSTLFVKAHLASSPSSLFILRRDQDSVAVDFTIFPIDEDEDGNQCTKFVDIPFLGSLFHYPKIVASCNGLICLDISSCNATKFVLWNASTKEFRLVPSPKLTDQARPFLTVATGFGFNNETDDYKLVRIVNYGSNADDFSVVRAEVFSWKTGSWRVIDGEMVHKNIGSCVIFPGQKGVLVDGALHWLALGAGNWIPIAYVVSFHLGTEECRKIKIPIFQRGLSTKIIALNGLLGLANYPPGDQRQTNRIELWALHGMEWIRSSSIDTVPHGLGFPMGVLDDGTLVMKCVEGNQSRLSLCNLVDGTFIKTVVVEGTHYNYVVLNYVESLVPV